MARAGIITYDFFPFIGGIGRFTYTIYCELNAKGVVFFSPAVNSLPGHILIQHWSIRLFKQVGVALWLFLNVHRIISKYNLDKLNIHSGAGGVLFCRKIGIPVIITCHHTYWQHYRYIPSQFWKRIFYPFEKRTYQLADTIICDCEDTRQVLMEQYGVPQGKMIIIPCALDGKQFYRTGAVRKAGSILYIGRIDTRKGVDFLIRSMSLVRNQLPYAHLLVGGTGRDLTKMKSLVTRLGLERSVTFLGFVPDNQLNELYNQAQCVVVPSIFEGFGITVIEAVAAGTRVVGTDVDGIRSTLKSGDYGTLVPYGDCRAMADAIVAELNNPNAAEELHPKFQLAHLKKGYEEILQSGTSNL